MLNDKLLDNKEIRKFITTIEAVDGDVIHRPLIMDNEQVRQHFLETAEALDLDTITLRYEKAQVYGISFCQNGLDSVFENIRRKYDIVAENMFRRLILARQAPTKKHLRYLYDGLLDLKNYSGMALWFIIAVYGDMLLEVKHELEEQRQV